MSRIMGGASRIIKGIQHFQQHLFGPRQSLFRRLATGQSPLALFITCSDSRINPNLLTQTEPGELFILRTAGNLIPPCGSPPSGEEATIEYALKQLHIHDVILCGHSQCGAMQGLLSPEALGDMPAVARWLGHARDILPVVKAAGEDLSPAELLQLAVERNVLLQMEHLKSYPFVAEFLAAGRLRLHGWVYHLATGEVTIHDPNQRRFVPLAEAAGQHLGDGVEPFAGGTLGNSI
jgi:carbonic anhydrase